MTQLFEFSVDNRDDAIYTRDELLVEVDGTPNHPDPPNRLIDLDELKIGSGWMRATAPSGRADFEGVVAWTPSATQGELPAEAGQSSSLRGDAERSDAGGSPPSPASQSSPPSPSRERESDPGGSA